MKTVTPRIFCETLYCGFTPWDAFSIDSSSQSISFDAVVTDNGHERAHHVEFQAVRSFTSDSPQFDANSDPDYRIELSVIEIEREPEGWRLWFNPWYSHEIAFRCDRILLDGTEVAGSGRWLQDELPPRVAG